MIYVILILILAVVILAFIIRFYLNENKNQDETINELKKENAALKAQKEKEHEIDQQTVETIEEITTGNNQHDFDAGVGILHDLSGKRKPTK